MIRDYLVREEPTIEVMKRAYYLFNWATIQSYKWKFNKGDPPDVRTLVTVIITMAVATKMMRLILMMMTKMTILTDDDRYDSV